MFIGDMKSEVWGKRKRQWEKVGEKTLGMRENENKRRKGKADSMIFDVMENFFYYFLRVLWAVVFRLLLPIYDCLLNF